MFKGYLQEHPRFFQLSVFVGIWSTLQLITLMLIPQVLSKLYGMEFTAEIFNGTDMDQDKTQIFLVINGISTFLTFVLPPILFASVAAPKTMEYLNLNQFNASKSFQAVLIGLGMVLVIPVLSFFLQQINWGAAAMENLEHVKLRNESIFADKSWQAVSRNLIALALLPAVGEELFFRGIIQRFSNSWTRNHMRSILFTALFFSIMHFQIVSFIPIFIGGVILGYLYYLTGSLWVSILAHFVYNGTQILMNAFELEDFGIMGNTIALGLGVLICYLGYKLVDKNRTPLPEDWSVMKLKTEKNEEGEEGEEEEDNENDQPENQY